MKTIVIGGLLAFASTVSAGGMTSGGGEMIRDLHNPWFLENTKTVTYCIELDHSSISASQSSVNELVERAIRQWNRIFSDYEKRNPQKNRIRIATQEWIKLSCQQSVDVRFQFGWGTLNSAQKEYLSRDGDPHRFIAIAVREDYDTVQMRAKGFVYIASDRGPHAFLREPSQYERPWRFPSLLFYELTHELGHIFGLPHLNTDMIPLTNRGIMSEYFPEMILEKWWPIASPTEMSYFFHPTRFRDCEDIEEAIEWFGAPKYTRCLEFVTQSIESFSPIQVRAIDYNGKYSQDLNSIGHGGKSYTETQSDIAVYLPPDQKAVPATGDRYAYGPGHGTMRMNGAYRRPDGSSGALLVTMGETYLSIDTGSILDFEGKTIPIIKNLIHASPYEDSESAFLKRKQ